MINSFIKYLKKQSFQPDLLSVFLNPFFFIRRSLFVAVKNDASLLKGKLLDFGCGRKPYQNLFTVDEYIGVDMETTGHDHSNSKADVYYDGTSLPFDNDSFDSVFSSEVLEHVFNPDEILQELHRVLKPGGKILLTIPFCWNEHEIPYDYARYSSYGISHLLQKHGFEVKHIKKAGTFARVNFQLWALYFFELFKKYKRTGYVLSMLFIIPINIVGVILLVLMPKNQSMYFNNIITAEKTSIAF